MYLKYSLGFLIASIIQAAIVMLAEFMKISSLNPKVSFGQLVTHILAGQIAGYILLISIRKVKWIGKVNNWILGFVFGFVVWTIVLSINGMLGKVKPLWEDKISVPTLIPSIFAFIIFGIIVVFTIKNNENTKFST